MIADLKPYPEYRSAEGQWLGKVPVHWAVRRFKYILREKDSRSVGGKEQLLRVSQFTGVTQRLSVNGLDEPDTRAASLVGYKCVNPDDLVINIMLAWNGSLGVSRYDGIASPAYCVYRFGEVAMPWYYHHLLRSPAYKARIKALSTGVVESRLRLYTDDLFRLEALLPPPDEQAAIVHFLNHTNQRIERTIRAKRKVIALLNEQKQVIIHRAVTRGLDPDVRLKPSGIPWLGEIPEGWEVISLHMRYSVELGKMLDSKRITGRNTVPYLRNRDVQWDRVLIDDLPTMDITPKEYSRYTVKKGDMLVCEGGQVGRAAFWNDQLSTCGYQKALHRVRAIDTNRDYPRYLFYVMSHAAHQGVFNADGNENTFAHLTCEKLRRHHFAYPSFTEQRNIADYLDNALQQYQVVISNTEREISLLREYRTRLIADVVTGKLDVREAAARLPDEADTSDGTDFVDTEDLDDSFFVEGGDDGNAAA
jgi:type I restriction enzyme, S subunit